MAKNIVICCDGTANEFAKNNTNVVKLYYTLVHDRLQQLTYYHPGLGTMEPVGKLTTFGRRFTKLLGRAIGYGLADDIRDAYVFLMNHFEEGDKLFLFGFSRGAYTARAVCSLLHLYGLIHAGNEALVPYAIRMMTGISRIRSNDPNQRQRLADYFDLAGGFRATLGQTTCRPWFVGVWDTVSSIGWIENPLQLPYVSNNPDIQIARHAVSIDERRAFFRSHLWRPDQTKPDWGPKDLKQVWFPGVHCDVGGGYPEKESGLAKISLGWMLQEAKTAGLLVDQEREREVLGLTSSSKYVKADYHAQPHESLKGAWNFAEFFLKKHFNSKTGKTGWRPNVYRWRTVPAHAEVHESVYERKGPSLGRLPKDAVRVPPLEVGEGQPDSVSPTTSLAVGQ